MEPLLKRKLPNIGWGYIARSGLLLGLTMVGFGKTNPKQSHDRGASCPSAPTNCTDVNGYSSIESLFTNQRYRCNGVAFKGPWFLGINSDHDQSGEVEDH